MNTGIGKSFIKSGLGVLISRALGLIRDIVTARIYGTGAISDIFFIAFTIPNLFRQFFAEGAISSAFIPFLSDKSKKTPKQAQNYFTQLLIVQFFIVTALIVILTIFAPFVLKIFSPGYSRNSQVIKLGTNLLRIVLPYLLFVTMGGLFAGYLSLQRSYFISYASTGCLNICMIVGGIVGYLQKNNIYPLAIGVFIGGVFQFLLMFLYARKKGFRFGSTKPKDPDIKKTYKIVLPSLAAVGVNQINFITGRIFASFLQNGTVSLLFYANRLFQLPLGIFSVTISNISLTEISKLRVDNKHNQIAYFIDKALLGLLIFMLPATIGLVLLSEDITNLIFLGKNFTAESAKNTSALLKIFSLSLIPLSFASVLTKVYHSDNNTATPFKISVIAVVSNIVLCLALIIPLKQFGIALASFVSSCVSMLFSYLGLKEYRFDFVKHSFYVLKILIANYIMLIVLIVAKKNEISLFINIFFCVIAYFSILRALKINILKVFK